MFALDREATVTITEGYDETKRKTVIQNLVAELNAGSESAGASAKIRAELQKTEETVQTWTTEQKSEVKIKYPADLYLTLWALIESVSVSRTTTEISSLGDRRQVTNTIGPTTVTTYVEQVKNVHQDKATKAQMKKMNPKEFRE